MYDIVNRNLITLGALIGGKLGAIDVIGEIIHGGLSIWVSPDALTYSQHKLITYTSANELDSERMIISWMDLPPNQMGIRSHFYLHSPAGLLMSAMCGWSVGFRALLVKKPEQTFHLYH